jgi:Sel1 repeat
LLAEGKDEASRNLFLLTADPDLSTYNPEQASEFLLGILARGEPGDESWVLWQYRNAVPALRVIVDRKVGVDQIYRRAAESGDAGAQFEYGLLLRQSAANNVDLQNSARWLTESAEAGNVAAMTELGYAMTIGMGAPPNSQMALTWLEKAAQAGDERAKELARLVRLGL